MLGRHEVRRQPAQAEPDIDQRAGPGGPGRWAMAKMSIEDRRALMRWEEEGGGPRLIASHIQPIDAPRPGNGAARYASRARKERNGPYSAELEAAAW